MHYQLTNLQKFKHYHLYETNEWLFNKAKNIFPALPTKSATQYRIVSKHITKTMPEKWSRSIKYERIYSTKLNEQNKPIKSQYSTMNNNREFSAANFFFTPKMTETSSLPNETKDQAIQGEHSSDDRSSTCLKCLLKERNTKHATSRTGSNDYPIRNPALLILVKQQNSTN